MKTAVVILNWNTEGFLREFLPGLVQSAERLNEAKTALNERAVADAEKVPEDNPGRKTEVIVADNASTDGSLKVLKEEFSDIRTIVFNENKGFTGGYNSAFEELYKTDRPEYFVLINSDIEVTENWLEPLVRWMDSHPECGACAPKLHSYQEREKFEYAGAAGGYIDKFGYPFCRGRILKRLETDKGQYDQPEDVFWATGACLMVRSSVYQELGGLDERFFAHMEEIDLCWRMQLLGYKVTVVPESVVYHVGGGTLPANSPFKLKLNYRNNLLMLTNNLAKTFALRLYKKGVPAEKAARKGQRQAECRIFQRKCLDGLSAAVYLLTGKTEYFKAVLKAHKEYSRLKGSAPQTEDIKKYLVTYGTKSSVTGIYSKWIILQSILNGKEIFESINKEDFYKI